MKFHYLSAPPWIRAHQQWVQFLRQSVVMPKRNIIIPVAWHSALMLLDWRNGIHSNSWWVNRGRQCHLWEIFHILESVGFQRILGYCLSKLANDVWIKFYCKSNYYFREPPLFFKNWLIQIFLCYYILRIILTHNVELPMRLHELARDFWVLCPTGYRLAIVLNCRHEAHLRPRRIQIDNLVLEATENHSNQLLF